MTTYRTLSTGSSPRMRGTRSKRIRIGGPPGIIPAYAGNTRRRSARRRSTRDHPRVCGEHYKHRGSITPNPGSSPRMRGTLRRMRRVFFLPGIIPAYAGNTWCRWAVARCPWDHPRVCGEHPHFSVVNNGGAGSSPRMRGTPLTRFMEDTADQDHPRVCGEHPICTTNLLCV